MSSDLSIKPFEAADAERWDRFAESSPDAWFFHTCRWRDYLREYAKRSARADLSFWVLSGQAELGIVPALLEDHDGRPSLSFAGEPLAAPALAPGLSPAKRRESLEFAVERLKEAAARHSIDSFQLRVPAVSPSALEAGLPQANPYLRLGALDLPFQTQVIDLRRELKELWSEVRHGTQADIRRAEKRLSVSAWDSSSITDDKFAQYQALHAKDAGRATRSQATFDLMRSWVRAGNAALFEARSDSGPAAFALLLLFAKAAYYGSSCKDPDQAALPSSHLIQWKAVEWLKSRGLRFYDLGQQHFENQWFAPASSKAAGISLFKRGLGGSSVPLHTAEFHATREGLCRAVEKRAASFREAGA